MIRAAELGMFVAPIVALVLWRLAVARGLEGPPPRQFAVGLAVFLVVEAALVTAALRDRFAPGEYVPALVRDGQIVPGHMEPGARRAP